MDERRKLDRVNYPTKSVVVLCDTGETFYVETRDVSPVGMGITMPAGSPDILGKDIIIVADTLIMYADVKRQVKRTDGTYDVGINAKKFTSDVLQYLFSHISSESDPDEVVRQVGDLTE